MSDGARAFGGTLAIVVIIVALVFAIGGLGLAYKAYFAPKHANVDRQVYEQSQSYVHGKIQDLAKYKQEYDKTDSPVERQAIQTLINQQFAQFDSSKIVDSNLRKFLVNMRGF